MGCEENGIRNVEQLNGESSYENRHNSQSLKLWKEIRYRSAFLTIWEMNFPNLSMYFLFSQGDNYVNLFLLSAKVIRDRRLCIWYNWFSLHHFIVKLRSDLFVDQTHPFREILSRHFLTDPEQTMENISIAWMLTDST